MDFFLKQILVGSMLGDGHLAKSNRKGESQLYLKYDDKSYSYLKWLYDKFSSMGLNEIKERSKGGYHQHYFRSKPNKEFGKFREKFYPEGTKIVPEDIAKLLTHPIAVSVWYMDDGSLDFRAKYHTNSTFSTFCFSFRECELLVKTLKDNFKIEARVHRSTMRGKERYRLYIVSEYMERFIKIIEPYLQPCFMYKIPIYRLERQQPR